ncbi:DUF72 domain-containing protein [Leptodesmis sp.]|uniref:DUF72 domain-containing protein n=1 Tax=Leptodesmis sp. TaxID=3100501 RepID=UPI0040535793
MSFLIGCALWGYKEWVGDLFPPGSRASEFLRLYSQRLTTVEGNTTFYSVPDQPTVNRWAAETPIGFQFCPKLPRTITHAGLLYPHLEEALSFLERMQGLGDRLGPLFAQLPPSYGPANLTDLAAFLTALPRTTAEFAIELRHPDWFTPCSSDRLAELLQELGIGRVLLDTRPIYDVPDNPQLHSERKKPKLPLQFSVTAPFSLVRYISHPDRDVNQKFLQDWVPHISQWLQQGTRIYFFVHCPLEERSPTNLRFVQHLFKQHQIPIPPLPWDGLDSFPVQLNLL